MQPFTFFISYRRQDTAPIALLLKYEIERRLQFVRAVVDVGAIRHGEHFPDRIKHLIDTAHATIVLIGRNWMPRRDQPSSNRMSAIADEDWIVKEIVHSMASPIHHDEADRYGLAGRAILPVFVNCERSFDQFDLPAPIAQVAYTQAEHIDYQNWPVAIGPLVDRIAINLQLKKRPDSDEYPKPDAAKGRTQSVPDQELASILKYEDYEGWYVDNFGSDDVRYLVKTFQFPHFNHASEFMELVADHCRVLNHHPEWRNVFNQVTVSLTTWDARRRVTIYDLNLALFMNKAAQAVLSRTNRQQMDRRSWRE